MTKRVCAQPGCPTRYEGPGSRCPVHTREQDQARGSRQERGYDAAHDRRRAQWQGRIDKGQLVICWRCRDRRLTGRDWHLGHCDIDRSKYHGPECTACNTSTTGRAGQGCPHPSHPPIDPPF